MKEGGRQGLEEPMGGKPGWGQAVYSAGVGGEQAGVCVLEHSGLVVLSPGLGHQLRVD